MPGIQGQLTRGNGVSLEVLSQLPEAAFKGGWGSTCILRQSLENAPYAIMHAMGISPLGLPIRSQLSVSIFFGCD